MTRREFILFYLAALFLAACAMYLAKDNVHWPASSLFMAFSFMLMIVLTQELREKK